MAGSQQQPFQRHLFDLLQKKKRIPSIIYREALEEALCFGWIDSRVKSIDGQSYKQAFTPRRPKSGWSKINKELAAALEERGLMTSLGRRVIEEAQKNGSWNLLDDCEAGIIPGDLEAALKPALRGSFEALKPAEKKKHLWLLKSAKTEATRAKRMASLLELLEQAD